MPENPYEAREISSGGEIAPRGSYLWTFLILGFVLLVAVLLLLPNVRSVRPAAFRNSCRNNLKQIGLALQNYVDKYGKFPPAYTVDANGKPLHSWRTLILPYLEEDTLYKSIDLSKPWDDPVNAMALKTRLPAYCCPAANFDGNLTNYQAIIGPHSCMRPGKSVSARDITDGTSKTVVLIEVPEAAAVPWMQPTDVDEAFFAQLAAVSQDGFVPHRHALMADGSVIEFDETTSPATRRAMVTIAGND